ncbi:transporter [Ideonella sp. B7]|uniref:SphA family protein n=1 Tax=Ideonella benzenivorans TaxID=2831643 RepID=UPI001CED80A4|nr:transporter [Ideonella benzenivorans]MCA6215641.1 transporter [Ideonella benzenivorans]
MPSTFSLRLTAGVLAALISAGAAQAYELPSINLGLTGFVDGAPPPAGPGLYWMSYVQPYQASHFKDAKGQDLPLPNSDISVTPWVNQFVYQSDARWLGGKLGGMLLLPSLLSASLDDGAGGTILGQTQTGMGDPVLGAFLQWDPVMGAQGPVFAHRAELDLTLPWGSYDKSKGLTPGAHATSVEAYWSGTWWVKPEWTVSSRVFYLWNGVNGDPSPTRFASSGITEAHSFQAGQAVHMNLATDYAITPQLRLGLAAYWLQQTTDTKVNGQSLADTKERVIGYGPGVMYSFSADDHLSFNYYTETGARNRTEGERATLRFIHHFR